MESQRQGPLYLDEGDDFAVVVRPTPPRGMGSAGILQIHAADARHAVATRGNMVFIAWRGETLVSAISNARKVLVQALMQRYASYGLMQYVEQGAPPPDTAARHALADMLTAGQGRLVCSSLVYPGTGFWAAAARAFVTGVNLLARPGFPHVVFPTVQEAAQWHTQLLERDPALTPADICKSIEDVRRTR